MEDAAVVLRRAPLFEGLDEESARALRRQMADVKLSRGEHLFLEGQDGDRLYVVLDGKIKLTRAAADGRENLLDLADRFGEQDRDGLHVHHDLTQEELAQLVGASRETVNKALADFAARGWLQISARSVLILDIERLRRRAR